MSDNQKYSNEDLDRLIKATIKISIEQTFQWIQHETVIIDIDTKEILKNAQITNKYQCKRLTEYVYPKLAEQGIHFIKEETNG